MTRTIALIGDYSPDITAHRAIPVALQRASSELPSDVIGEWVHTSEIGDPAKDLARFSGVWAVPGSPYANPNGALEAIRWARETKRPFLGTCGGFQHALIEFARSVLKLSSADHAETNPAGERLVVTRLACSLVETVAPLQFAPGSRLRGIYGRESAIEGYRCNYGPSTEYVWLYEAAGFQFTAWDEANQPRAAELTSTLHPFFMGTLFQPERAALRGETPPLVRAFVVAALTFPR